MIEAFQLHGEMPTFPVIVVHLEDPMGSGLAACSGIPFRTTDQYQGVPRFLCPGCARPPVVDPSWRVHDHGPEEGRGVECREYRINDRLLGECMIEAAR